VEAITGSRPRHASFIRNILLLLEVRSKSAVVWHIITASSYLYIYMTIKMRATTKFRPMKIMHSTKRNFPSQDLTHEMGEATDENSVLASEEQIQIIDSVVLDSDSELDE